MRLGITLAKRSGVNWKLASWLISLSALVPASSSAGTFDPQGRFVTTAPGTGFEPGQFRGTSASGQAREVIAVDAETLASETTPDALEGTSALRLARNRVFGLRVDLAAATGASENRRVKVRLWQRRLGGRVRPQVLWRSPGDATFVMGALVLTPSGRVTSDGWEEWVSDAFDFLLGGVLAPELVLEDAGSTGNPFSTLPERAVAIDAIEVEDLGPAELEGRACGACGPAGRCRFGRCADRVVVEGPGFSRAVDRDAYVARRRFEWETFLGHRAAREQDPATASSFEALAQLEEGFWPAFGRLIDATRDGHAQRPIVGGVSGLASGACLQLGEADLLPGAPSRPMVFRSSGEHPAGLEPGDVLTTVDGEPLEAFLERRRDDLVFSGDPRIRDVAVAPQLGPLAAREGLTLGLQRCDAGGACSAVEVDYAALAEPLWRGELPDWARPEVPCDPRFDQSGDVSDIAASDHVDVIQQDGVTRLRINATTGPNFGDFSGWTSEVDAAFATSPGAMVLDQRRGDGGSFLGLFYLARHFFFEGDTPISVVVPWLFRTPNEQALLGQLATCARTSPSAAFNCGGAQWITAQAVAPNVPGAGAAANAKVAILTGLNVSGNDWLTDFLRRRRGNTRVFGPAPTFGAFGEVVGLPAHDLGFFGPRIQLTGGIVATGALDPLTTFLDGDGVEPDVVVLQKQSDTLLGVDTQLREAQAWLAE